MRAWPVFHQCDKSYWCNSYCKYGLSEAICRPIGALVVGHASHDFPHCATTHALSSASIIAQSEDNPTIRVVIIVVAILQDPESSDATPLPILPY
jgi:hypothetical protein